MPDAEDAPVTPVEARRRSLEKSLLVSLAATAEAVAALAYERAEACSLRATLAEKELELGGARHDLEKVAADLETHKRELNLTTDKMLQERQESIDALASRDEELREERAKLREDNLALSSTLAGVRFEIARFLAGSSSGEKLGTESRKHLERVLALIPAPEVPEPVTP